MNIAISEKTKCKGEAPDGTKVCGYRNWCNRFVPKDSTETDIEEFWRAGDDCPQFLSIPKG
jgi:hypothetical protein